MAIILRVGAVVQMVLGVAGFLAAFGLFDPWPWKSATVVTARDPLTWFALILVSAFLFNLGGVPWLAVHNTYRPKPPALPVSAPG
ncbi:MAG: hypothetical protein K2X87_27190 [Gemmataceae bacterium]|nr:hypothetical protein [Gemmataceae bacterium]